MPPFYLGVNFRWEVLPFTGRPISSVSKWRTKFFFALLSFTWKKVKDAFLWFVSCCETRNEHEKFISFFQIFSFNPLFTYLSSLIQNYIIILKTILKFFAYFFSNFFLQSSVYLPIEPYTKLYHHTKNDIKVFCLLFFKFFPSILCLLTYRALYKIISSY